MLERFIRNVLQEAKHNEDKINRIWQTFVIISDKFKEYDLHEREINIIVQTLYNYEIMRQGQYVFYELTRLLEDDKSNILKYCLMRAYSTHLRFINAVALRRYIIANYNWEEFDILVLYRSDIYTISIDKLERLTNIASSAEQFKVLVLRIAEKLK